MAIISIDGACRRNGKPDCVSSGGLFILPHVPGAASMCAATHETASTNQRGELHALNLALELGVGLYSRGEESVYMITDSEYMFNTITKEWYRNWSRKGWITAGGEPVKNKDLWQRAAVLLEPYEDKEFVVYHIKGHVIPFGKVTAQTLLKQDPTGKKLYEAVGKKFDEVQAAKKDVIEAALALFERNNGFIPPFDKFREMVICNIVADNVATVHVDENDIV